MIEIKDLLEKFNQLILSEEGKRNSVAKVISDVLKTDIDPKDVRIKGNTVYLNIRPIFKNELLLKQDKIQEELTKAFLGKNPNLNIR